MAASSGTRPYPPVPTLFGETTVVSVVFVVTVVEVPVVTVGVTDADWPPTTTGILTVDAAVTTTAGVVTLTEVSTVLVVAATRKTLERVSLEAPTRFGRDFDSWMRSGGRTRQRIAAGAQPRPWPSCRNWRGFELLRVSSGKSLKERTIELGARRVAGASVGHTLDKAGGREGREAPLEALPVAAPHARLVRRHRRRHAQHSQCEQKHERQSHRRPQHVGASGQVDFARV